MHSPIGRRRRAFLVGLAVGAATLWLLTSELAVARHRVAPTSPRPDGARLVALEARSGSFQNPAWSPDSRQLLVTFFDRRYNQGRSTKLLIHTLAGPTRTLYAGGRHEQAVSAPGRTWHPVTGQIIFSSDRGGHDELFAIPAVGSTGDEVQLTDRMEEMAFEPSWSPDGTEVVFESHRSNQDDAGVITRYRLDGSEGDVALTDPALDSRQPNWSATGEWIVYQRLDGGQWDLWLVRPDGSDNHQLTANPGDDTDASFSLDGSQVVYSANQPDQDGADIYTIALDGSDRHQITTDPAYDGAPSWSPDGKLIAFESTSESDPNRSRGARIWLIGADGQPADEPKPPVPPAQDWWQPPLGARWWIQYSRLDRLDLMHPVDLYNLDLFDTSPETIQILHDRGVSIMCYVSAGTWEPWRLDADSFPAEVLGQPLADFPDERWLDIRAIDQLRPIMADRLDRAVEKGCGGVDPDNVDGFTNPTGFPLSADDQLTYNRLIAQLAHDRKLGVGLKNNAEQAAELAPEFDWAVVEECVQFAECEAFLPFVQAGKPVFHIEYQGSLQTVCQPARDLLFSSIKKRINLDDYQRSCWR